MYKKYKKNQDLADPADLRNSESVRPPQILKSKLSQFQAFLDHVFFVFF